MSQTKYNIYLKGKKIASNLTEDMYFEKMEDFSRDFMIPESPILMI